MLAWQDIPTLLERLGRDEARTPALTFYRGPTRVARLDYGELAARVARTAARLRALGVGSDDRVGLASANRLEVPVALLALWRLGAVAVPLNPQAPHDWSHVLDHAGARACLATQPHRQALQSLTTTWPLEACWDGPDGAPDDLRASATAPAIILYTSGTTGRPKGVVLSQRNLITNGAIMARHFGLERSTQLAVLPLHHAHALGFGLMSALSTRGHLVFSEGFDPWSWAAMVRAESVEVASLVPTLLPLLLQAHVTHDQLPSLRALLVSSAPLSRELARQFEEATAIPLVHGWGLSEFTNFACCIDPDEDPDDRRRLLWTAEVPSVGSPLPGTEVSVRDEQGRPVGEFVRGELCVRGGSRMIAYHHDPEATERTLWRDWLRTGDQGYYRVIRGRSYFYVTARLKEIIIRGGEKYSPLALEQTLLAELPELSGHVAVVGFPHAMHGEEIGAYLDVPSLSDASRSRILQATERLPPDLRPKIILHGAAAIPRTHTGKVQRRQLMPLFAAYQSCRGPTRLIASP